MKRTILTELVIIILIAGISTGLFHLIYGIDLSYDNYFDMLLFEVRRMMVIFGIVGHFFLPIYLAFNIGRLVYHKFLKLYITVEIIISSIVLMAVLFYYYLFLGLDGLVMAEEGWTIYPPLSVLPSLEEHDPVKLQSERNLQLILISFVFLVALVLTIVTIRRRKKYLAVILIFSASNLFGQFNPMFDSLDYFERNKIETIYCKANSWWYASPFKSWEISFNKEKKTKTYHSYVVWDTTIKWASAIATAEPASLDFKFRDTIIKAGEDGTNTEIKHVFDSKKRLQKKLVINNNFPVELLDGFRYSDKDTIGSSSGVSKAHVTSTTYYYMDTSSKKIKKIITESPYHIKETNFYYEKFLLSMITELDSNKNSQVVDFEVIRYDYYPDRKLKRETRRVATEYCPGIAGHASCEGSIEYKYDTEFPNDSTPILGIPYQPLLTIENKLSYELWVEIWGYSGKDRRRQFSERLYSDSNYVIAFDPRPDRKYILQLKKNWSPVVSRDKYEGFEIIVYSNPNKKIPFETATGEILLVEKHKIEPLFKKPKTITVKNKQ
jgi:hypothetical protein